jgi:hypothetical protein
VTAACHEYLVRGSASGVGKKLGEHVSLNNMAITGIKWRANEESEGTRVKWESPWVKWGNELRVKRSKEWACRDLGTSASLATWRHMQHRAQLASSILCLLAMLEIRYRPCTCWMEALSLSYIPNHTTLSGLAYLDFKKNYNKTTEWGAERNPPSCSTLRNSDYFLHFFLLLLQLLLFICSYIFSVFHISIHILVFFSPLVLILSYHILVFSFTIPPDFYYLIINIFIFNCKLLIYKYPSSSPSQSYWGSIW